MFTLLYIDDEPGLLELGKLFLESTGEFTVTTALSGEDGLDLLARQDFDAIVSDFQMPVMDGIELLKRVRRAYGTIPFILFTGRGREEVVIEAINNGVDFYLQKGGDPRAQFAELALKVRQAVNRRRAETALLESEKRLADIINFLPDATFAIDTDGIVIAWNRAIEDLTGVAAADMLGKGNFEYAIPFYGNRRPILIDLISEPDDTIATTYTNIRRDGAMLSAETDLATAKGRRIYVLAKASPLYNQDGNVAGAIEAIRDISDRKITEDALNESERRFRDLAELLPQGVFETDTAGMVTYANRIALEMYGYTDDDIRAGLEFTRTIIPGERESVAAAFRRVFTEGSLRRGSAEYQVVRKDGSTFPVAIFTSPVTRDGKISGIRGIIMDITERRRAEEELRATHEQLVASEEELRAQYDELALNEKQARTSEARLKVMLGFSRCGKRSEKELLDYAIEGAGIITGSPLAYLAFVNEDESELTMYAWSKTAMAECAMPTKPIVYKVAGTGLWGEAVRQRRPVITNDYAAPNPAKKGYPEGHPRIIRHMNVPVIDNGRVVLVAGVANKAGEYSENDANELLLLTRGLWEILQRRRAEATREESEAKFRNIIENAPAGMHFYTLEPEGSLIFGGANPGADRILGMDHHPLIGKTIEEAFPALAGTEIPAQYRRVARDGDIWQTDQVTYEGEVIHGAFAVTAFRIGPGAMVAMFMDITDRKRAEAALQATYDQVAAAEEELREQYDSLAAAQAEISSRRRQLEEIAARVPGVVYQFYARPDGSRGMYFTSSRTDDVFGLKTGLETFFTEFTSCIPPEDRAGFLASIEEAVQNKTDWHYEGRFVRRTGETIWFEGRSSPAAHGDELVFTGVILDITGRKRAEDELLRLKISVDRSSDEIFWMDFTGSILYVNDAACRITGYSREEFMKMKIFDLDPDFPPDVWEASVADLRAKKTQFITTRHRCKDGSILDVEILAVYVNQYDREYSFAYVRDITERRRTEDALFNSEQMLHAVLDSIPQRVFWKDRNLVYLGCNRPLAEDAGYADPRDLAGKTDYDTASKETADKYRADDLRVMETGIPRINFEEPQIRADGSTAWLRTTKVPLRNKDGAIIGVLGTYEDITGRKRTEEALRESEEKYRTLVESSFDGIVIHQDGVVVYINRTGARLYGSDDPGTIIGKEALELIAPESRPFVAKRIREAPEKPLALIRERLLRLDGTVMDADVSTTPTSWKGKPAAYVTFRDITTQVRAEAALRESEEKYRTLVESSFDGIAIHQDGVLVYINRTAAHILGSDDPSVFIGRSALSVVAPEFREKISERVQLSMEQSMGLIREQFLRLDGSLIDVDVTTIPATWEGKPAAYVTFRDISAQVRAEKSLRESEEKYRTLVEMNRDIIYSIDTSGIILYVSPQVEVQLGYPLSEMEGKPFIDFVHPDDAGILIGHITDHAGSGGPVVQDRFRLQRKDGTYRWFEDKTIYTTDLKGTRIVTGTIRDITEEKAAQDAVRESEEKFRALVESTSDFIWEVDAEGRYSYVSPQVRQILGYEPEELIGQTPFDVMPPDEVERVSAEFRRNVEAKLPIVTLVNKALRKDGTVVVLETSGVVRTGQDGSYQGYRGIDRDITVRKQSEQALRESEARLSSILHGSPVLQFVIDRNHRVISWNRALEEYSGIKEEDITGTDDQWRAFYPNRRPVLADILVDGNTEALERHYAGKYHKSRYVDGAYEATDFFPHMGGAGKWLFFTAAPVRDVSGTIIGAVETLEDVSERVNAENAIKESEEWTRVILNSAQVGIVMVDAISHTIVHANRKALELIGLDRERVVGAVCNRFICPAEKGKCPVTDQHQNVDTSERVLMTANGETIPVLKTVVPVTIRGRSMLVESFVDISDQKRSEAAVREASRKINLLNSITRHDIRNQLMVAQGFAQLAALSKPGPAVEDFLAKISTAIETIQRQIEFTKTYQELGVHAPAWFPVDEIVRSVRPEQIVLNNTCREVEIYADQMIAKVFFNLFQNAVKHGERVTEITIGCEEIDEYLVITVADNGIGIPDSDKKRIFEEGYRKTTGHGLFLVREILAITGITIHENGTWGKGAVFEIIVPKGAYRKAA